MKLLRFRSTDGLVHLAAGRSVMGAMRCELPSRVYEHTFNKSRSPVPGPTTCLQCLVLEDDERFGGV